MKTRIIVDSTSDLLPQIKERVHVVPLTVHFGQQEYIDGVTIDHKTFYEKLIETDVLPTTSQATPVAFARQYEAAKEAGEEALVITISSNLSGTYQSAVIAAEERDYVHFVDTKQVSVGICNVVIEMAKALEANPEMEIEEAVARSKELIEHAKMCFMPDNLEFLRAGGRVSNAAYLGSRNLNIHPTIEILDGKLTATKKYRGKMTKVAAQLVKDYAELYNLKRDHIWVVYTIGLTQEVRETIETAIKECGFAEASWIQAAGVITTHGGPAAFGIAGFSK